MKILRKFVLDGLLQWNRVKLNFQVTRSAPPESGWSLTPLIGSNTKMADLRWSYLCCWWSWTRCCCRTTSRLLTCRWNLVNKSFPVVDKHFFYFRIGSQVFGFNFSDYKLFRLEKSALFKSVKAVQSFACRKVLWAISMFIIMQDVAY